jgi:hypothetical protein
MNMNIDFGLDDNMRIIIHFLVFIITLSLYLGNILKYLGIKWYIMQINFT